MRQVLQFLTRQSVKIRHTEYRPTTEGGEVEDERDQHRRRLINSHCHSLYKIRWSNNVQKEDSLLNHLSDVVPSFYWDML